MFFTTVLNHPDDAHDGRPRGRDELIQCFDQVPLKKGIIVVSDAWRGTLAAINSIRRREGWGLRTLRHEICVHSRGEVVNARGFSSNQVENRWSVLKRWMRKRYGGRLPVQSDRQKWSKVINEFRYRKFVQRNNTLDNGHTWIVPTKVFCNHMRQLRSVNNMRRLRQ